MLGLKLIHVSKSGHWGLTWINFNSLWPSDTISWWWHRSESALAQAMAWCLMAPSHYLKQCWLLISQVLWHSHESNLTMELDIQADIIWCIVSLKIILSKLLLHLPGATMWVGPIIFLWPPPGMSEWSHLFKFGVMCCMLSTFHVSSRIVANKSESSFLFSQRITILIFKLVLQNFAFSKLLSFYTLCYPCYGIFLYFLLVGLLLQ